MSSTQASANCSEIEAACKRVIEASGNYIAELKKENEMQQTLLEHYEITERSMRQDITKLDKELNSWYRDPATMVLLGLFTGMAVGISISK